MLAACCALLATQTATATDFEWTGATNTLWDNPLNWSPNNMGFPESGDTTLFPGTASQFTIVLGLDHATDSISFAGATGYSIDGAFKLTLQDGTLDTTDDAVTHTINSDLKLQTGGQWSLGTGSEVVVNGQVSGNGGPTKTGDGVLVLNSQNTFTGGTTIDAGQVRVGHALALEKSKVTLNINQGLDVNGVDTTIGTLAGAGDLDLDPGNAANPDLTLSGSGGATTYTGSLTGSGTGSSASRLNLQKQADLTVTNSIQDFNRVSVDGRLTVEAGATVTNTSDLVVGTKTSSTGRVMVEGMGSTWDTTRIEVGGRETSGKGILDITAGAAVSTTTNLSIGTTAASTGTVKVDGAGSDLDVTNILYVGYQGSGTLMVTDGGQVSSDTGQLGFFVLSSANGDATVSDTDSRWDMSGNLTIGAAITTSGSLTIAQGGVVTNNSASVGLNTQSAGTVLVKDEDSAWINNGDLVVGGLGSASMTISSGGSVSNTNGQIGTLLGGDGTVTVTGNNTLWDNTETLQVGGTGIGELNINNDGTVAAGLSINIGLLGVINLNGGTLRIPTVTGFTKDNGGLFQWSTGRIQVTGPEDVLLGSSHFLPQATVLSTGQVLHLAGALVISNNQVLVLDGGQVALGAFSLLGGAVIGDQLDIDTVTSLTGHGIVATEIAGTSTTITATGPLSLGVIASTAGYDFGGTLDIATHQVVLNDADKAQLGTATTLAAGGRLNAVNGATLGAGETLTASGPAIIQGAFTNNGDVHGPLGVTEFLTFDDPVDGTGDFPTGNIQFLQGYAPGASPAEIQFGNVSFGPFATLDIELGGLIPGSEHDRVNVTGNASLDGTLNIEIIDGFDTDIVPFDTFTVMTWGTNTGNTEFGSVTFTPPVTIPGIGFEVQHNEFDLSIAATGLGGDANLDGMVDLTDLTILAINFETPFETRRWRKADFNNDGLTNLTDLTILAINFGAMVNAGAILPGTGADVALLAAAVGLELSGAAVPEPSTLVCLVLLAWPRRGRRAGQCVRA